MAMVGYALAAVAVLLVPVAASASVVIKRLGPFDTPFQPVADTAITKHPSHRSRRPPAWPRSRRLAVAPRG